MNKGIKVQTTELGPGFIYPIGTTYYFAVYQDFDNYAVGVLTGITRTQLMNGLIIQVDMSTTKIKIDGMGSNPCGKLPVDGFTLEFPLPTRTPTPTPTPTPTNTPTNTVTPTNTPTNTVTPSITPTISVTPSITPTNTPTPTVTPTNTNTPTITPTPSSTPGFIPIITSGLTIYGDANLGHSYPGTGTIITDLSGNGYNGNLINGTLFSGGTPNSFKYDGVNDYIQFPGYNGPDNIDYTWGCWVRLNSGLPTMWMKGQSSSDWGLRLEMDGTGQFNAGAAASLTSGGTVSGIYAYSTTIIPNITSWYYIVGVWDSATSIKFYLNGVLESTTLTTRGFLRNSTLGWNSGIYGTTFSNNWVADFEVYARVLSDAEVLYNYNANKSKYGY